MSVVPGKDKVENLRECPFEGQSRENSSLSEGQTNYIYYVYIKCPCPCGSVGERKAGLSAARRPPFPCPLTRGFVLKKKI